MHVLILLFLISVIDVSNSNDVVFKFTYNKVIFECKFKKNAEFETVGFNDTINAVVGEYYQFPDSALDIKLFTFFSEEGVGVLFIELDNSQCSVDYLALGELHESVHIYFADLKMNGNDEVIVIWNEEYDFQLKVFSIFYNEDHKMIEYYPLFESDLLHNPVTSREHSRIKINGDEVVISTYDNIKGIRSFKLHYDDETNMVTLMKNK